MKETRLKCPKYKHDRFIRRVGDIVEIIDDGECLRDEFIQGESGHEYSCAECGADVTDEELVR